jgi:hypothetical protein
MQILIKLKIKIPRLCLRGSTNALSNVNQEIHA